MDAGERERLLARGRQGVRPGDVPHPDRIERLLVLLFEADEDRTCKDCGASFEVHRHQRNRARCDKCRFPPSAPSSGRCLACGVSLTGRRRLYCSSPCKKRVYRT